MKSYKIFIGYSSEDDREAQYIHDCLARIDEFIPYKAEIYPEFGDEFKDRLQTELSDSFCMVVLLTKHGKNSQWVNQEIGYAYALKQRANLPYIIPLSHEKVELKGFITKASVDILFLDKYNDVPELVIYDIVTLIRSKILRGLEDNVLHFWVACSSCLSENNLPVAYLENLPSHQFMFKAIQSGKHVLESICPKCKTKNNIDGRTFLPYKSEK